MAKFQCILMENQGLVTTLEYKSTEELYCLTFSQTSFHKLEAVNDINVVVLIWY